MQTRPRPTSRPTDRSARERRPRVARSRVSVAYAVAERPEERARCAGGPIDSALYSCDCGQAFTEPVTTSVSCPACGQTQDW